MIKHSGPQILRDDEKALLMEMASEYKNHSSFSFFPNLKSKMVIDWPDFTQLATALVVEEDFAVAKPLYYAHILEITKRIHHGETDKIKYSELCTAKEWAESMLIPQIVLKLKEKDLDSGQIGKILSKLVLYPTTLIRLKNFEISQAYLPLTRPERTFLYSKSIFRLLVKHADPQHLELFLRHRPDFSAGLSDLFKALINNLRDLDSHEAGRAFIKIPIKLELVDESTLYVIENVLKLTNKENIEIFFKYDYRSFIKSRLDGLDVMASVFGNCNPGVLELLKNYKIDLNARGTEGRTPLHFAALGSATENICFLLSRGADPNALDQFKLTPLSWVLSKRLERKIGDEECIKKLIIGGSDILYRYETNVDWREFFGIAIYDQSPESHPRLNVIELLLAQLAICEALELPIDKPMEDYEFFQRRGYGNKCYEQCREQLQKLKSHKFRNSSEFCDRKFTMFALLSERVERIARYINEEDQNVIAKFMEMYRKENLLIPFYYETLENHIQVINQIFTFVSETKRVLSVCMNIADVNHLVINEIINYLTIQDFLI